MFGHVCPILTPRWAWLCSQRTIADKLLQQFKEHPQAWTRVDFILENARQEETKYFGLQVRCCGSRAQKPSMDAHRCVLSVVIQPPCYTVDSAQMLRIRLVMCVQYTTGCTYCLHSVVACHTVPHLDYAICQATCSARGVRAGALRLFVVRF